MVTGLLALTLRFTAEVMAAELVTGVVVAELLCTLLPSAFRFKKKENTGISWPALQKYNTSPIQGKPTASEFLGC